jgi:nucleoside-diphosphate-sugar epimerase
MKVSIIGFGWFGFPLALTLKKHGHFVIGTTRNEDKKNSFHHIGLDVELLNEGQRPDSQLFHTDCLILNIPPRDHHLEWYRSWEINPDQKIIFISSTSERNPLPAQEEWVKSSFKNWVILRFGGLVGPNRHPGKFLAGKENLPGQLWPVNMLHLDDAIGFTNSVLEKNITNETISVVCDDHRTREDFYSYFSKVLNLKIPEFDKSDLSTKNSINNDRAKELYQFKWPIISEKSL